MKVLAKNFGIACVSLMAGVLHASDASHGGGINWWGLGTAYKDAPALGWLFITFAIFIAVLVKVIRKPLALYLETRSRDIQRLIEEGVQARIKSEEKLKIYDEKLKSLGHEIETLEAHFREQAGHEKKERERLSKEAEERLLRETDDSIKASFERSKHRLAEELIANALLLAQKTIASKNLQQVDEHLKNTFIEDLTAHTKEMRS